MGLAIQVKVLFRIGLRSKAQTFSYDNSILSLFQALNHIKTGGWTGVPDSSSSGSSSVHDARGRYTAGFEVSV